MKNDENNNREPIEIRKKFIKTGGGGGKGFGKILLTLLLVFIVAVLVFMSFTTINTGQIGLKTRFGRILDTYVTEGINFKIPFIEEIVKVDTRALQRIIDTEIESKTKDNVEVYGWGFTVVFEINPAAAKDLYIMVGSDFSEMTVRTPMVSAAFKDAVASIPSQDIASGSVIDVPTTEFLQKKIDARYGEGAVSILQVIVSDVKFTEAYNNAIAQKNNAQVKYEQQQIENRTIVEQAESTAKADKIRAEMKAEIKLIEANAEAEANRIITESITEQILKMEELEARKIHGWVTTKGADIVVKDSTSEANVE